MTADEKYLPAKRTLPKSSTSAIPTMPPEFELSPDDLTKYASRPDLLKFKSLEGKKYKQIEVNKEKTEIIFTTTTGRRYLLYHREDCCESVSIDDIVGDLKELIGEYVYEAYESTNVDQPPLEKKHDSYTWTFYILRSQKTSVTIKWYGYSNGYYSEQVDLIRLPDEEE